MLIQKQRHQEKQNVNTKKLKRKKIIKKAGQGGN